MLRRLPIPCSASASRSLATSLLSGHLLLGTLLWMPSNTPGWAQGAMDFEGLLPQILQSSDPAENQFIDFGRSVDVDQRLLVVGAPGEGSAIDGDSDVGAVYVFERQAGSWVRIQKLRAPTENASGRFGDAVAVAQGSDEDGDLDFLFVGEPRFPGPMVHIYSRTAGGLFTFDSTHTEASGTRFGEALDLDFFVPPNSPSGDPFFFAAVGAPGKRDPSDAGNNQHGSVAIFQRTGDPGTWAPSHEFFGEPGQFLGTAVAMSASNVIVAANLSPIAPGGGFGGARWYAQGNFDGVGYHYAGDCQLLPDFQTAHVGEKTVATVVPVTYLPVAAFGMPEDDEIAFNNGKVLIFDLSSCIGNIITPADTLYSPDTSQSEQFGASLAFHETTLAIGAPGTLVSNSGKVYLFERGASNSDWNHVTTLTIDHIDTAFSSCRGTSSLAMDAVHLVAGCPAGASPQHEAAYTYGLEIFSDGFESGSVSAWP